MSRGAKIENSRGMVTGPYHICPLASVSVPSMHGVPSMHCRIQTPRRVLTRIIYYIIFIYFISGQQWPIVEATGVLRDRPSPLSSFFPFPGRVRVGPRSLCAECMAAPACDPIRFRGQNNDESGATVVLSEIIPSENREITAARWDSMTWQSPFWGDCF